MAHYSWVTDCHLNFLGDTDDRIIRFAESLIESDPAGIFITGDISTASRLVYHLSVFERVVERQIFFVLGNHDFYGNNIVSVRKQMIELCGMSQYLKYMSSIPYVSLNTTTALVGHDGWYDTLYGDRNSSRFMMSDWNEIADFAKDGIRRPNSLKQPDMAYVISQSQKLAHEATLHVMNGIKHAARTHKNVIILTHIPPFAQAHLYKGRPATADALPFYTSKLMGDMLAQASNAYPNVRFDVFAGHTHEKYDGQIGKNLYCHVGGAEYNDPKIQSLINI